MASDGERIHLAIGNFSGSHRALRRLPLQGKTVRQGMRPFSQQGEGAMFTNEYSQSEARLL